MIRSKNRQTKVNPMQKCARFVFSRQRTSLPDGCLLCASRVCYSRSDHTLEVKSFLINNQITNSEEPATFPAVKIGLNLKNIMKKLACLLQSLYILREILFVNRHGCEFNPGIFFFLLLCWTIFFSGRIRWGLPLLWTAPYC